MSIELVRVTGAGAALLKILNAFKISASSRLTDQYEALIEHQWFDHTKKNNCWQHICHQTWRINKKYYVFEICIALAAALRPRR